MNTATVSEPSNCWHAIPLNTHTHIHCNCWHTWTEFSWEAAGLLLCSLASPSEFPYTKSPLMWKCFLSHSGLQPMKGAEISGEPSYYHSIRKSTWWPRVCVGPVAGGYPGSLCLMARDHPSATSGSARASCKAWEPAGGRGALGAACAELRSSSAYCSRWWRVETSSVRGRHLRVQVPVSGSEPSYLRRVKTHRLMLHILTDLSKSSLRKTVCSLFTSYDETLVLWWF